MNTDKIKRSLTMGLLLLIAAVTATAQNSWIIRDTTILKSEQVQMITFELALENKDAVTALQFDLVVPEGLTLGDGVQLNSDRVNGHSLAMNEQADGSIRFVVTSANSKALIGNSGTLLSLPVEVGTDFQSGNGLSMKNIVMSDVKGNSLVSSTALGKIYLKVKQPVKVSIAGLEQTVSENGATVSITTVPAEIKEQVSVKYYTDENCTTETSLAAIKTAGIYYIVVSYKGSDVYEAYNDTFRLVINNKKNVDFGVAGTTFPIAAPILQGQHLSASILTGGEAMVSYENEDPHPLPGSFAWTDGHELATSTGLYRVTFTPDDQANYNTKDTTIQLTVIPVYTVFVSNGEHGTISAQGISSSNQYAEGEQLFLSAVPATNYQFVKWSNGITSDTITWTVNRDETISATFAPITRKVDFVTGAGGTLSIQSVAGQEIVSGSQVQQGTELVIMATPNEGYKLKGLTLNKESFVSSKYVVGAEDLLFNASFEVVANEYPVTVASTGNGGVVRLYKADGTAIPSGTALEDGTAFQVMALANAGYVFEGLTINDETVEPTETDGQIFNGKVNKATTVKATFTTKAYKLSMGTTAGGTLKVTDSNGVELSNDQSVLYGTSVVVKEVIPNEGFKMTTLVVNGRRIDSYPATFTVNSDIHIAVAFEELTTIKDEYLINAEQTYRFNNQNKQYFIWKTQTHASNFDIQYKKEGTSDYTSTIPVKAGTYSMKVSREADDIYKKYESGQGYFDQKLIIQKAKIAVKEAPTSATEKGKASIENVAITVDDLGDYRYKFTYTPTGEDANNYEAVTYILSTNPTKVTLNTQNMLRSASEPNGYVRISNGGLSYAADAQIPVGTTITVEAVPNEGYKFKSWSGRSETTQSIDVTVAENTNLNFVPVFEGKQTLTASLKSTSSAYTGSVQHVELATAIENAQIGIYKDAACTQAVELKNIGAYYVRVYREATADCNEVRDTLTYTINPTAATIDLVPTTTEIAEGETLAQVQLLGGSAGVVPGTFSWKDSTAVVKKGTNKYAVIFTSADPNYGDVETQVEVVGLAVIKSTPTPDPDPTPDPEPTPDTPTSIEDIASETILVVQKNRLVVYPCAPVELFVVSINGKYVFQGTIDGTTNIDVHQSGVYIVSFMKEGKRVSRKVNVL